MMGGNAIHDAERSEWRSAVATLTEMQRAACEPDYQPSDDQPDMDEVEVD